MKRVIIFIASLLFAKEPIIPIPNSISYDREKAYIGKLLFFDPILSKDRTVSCVSCHDFEYGGADPRAVSIGVEGKKGDINSPTVYNAVFNSSLFWNGRAKDLYEQLDGPLLNPVEMAMDRNTIEQRLNASPLYKKLFLKVYKKSFITYEMVKDALVEFEKALITPNSKFDRYLQGKTELSPKEKEGYLLFKKLGCITCHNGINIGGNSYQKIGSVIPYDGKIIHDRSEVTGKKEDRGLYRVAPLRNIALTAPYFHDASAKTLQEAVSKIAYHNLGFSLNKQEIEKIVAFLHTLTGEKPEILDEN